MTATAGPAGRYLQLAGGVPRPLPRPVRPLRDETMSSYTSRLAAANHLPYGVVLDLLWQYRTGTAADPLARVRWFAAVTGLDPAAAMMALPELRTGRPGPARPLPLAGRPVPHLARRAAPCRYCAAAHGAAPDADTGTQVFASAENNVCRAHQTWIGPGNDSWQPGLRGCPDITAAQTRHYRLIRRHGRRETFKAFLDAREIWATLEWLHGYNTERDQRIGRLLRPGTSAGGLDYDDPLHHAATYPETIALTAILASPRWRQTALARAPADRELFHAEFTRRVTPRHPQPAILLRLVRERLTDPSRRHRISDVEAPHAE